MNSIFLRYVRSHIYDIYSILAGMITLAIVMVLKIPIKRFAHKMADRCVQSSLSEKEWENRKRRIYRRWNGLIFLLAMVVALLVFMLVASVSQQITFSWGSAGMSGVIAIAAYGVLDQITYGW